MSIQPDLAPASFAAGLASHGNRPAVFIGEQMVTYRELAARVEAVAVRLGPVRRLVALAAANDLDSLVSYLAALVSGHALILAPADKPAALESLVEAYDPDVIMRSGYLEPVVEERRSGTCHDLYPGLALLLSTSGSTGSPKLVRLSHENLQSNAESIASFLQIESGDRAATTLPIYYCYGLSVINSHLLRGASLVLTDLSVVDPCFWELFRSRRATTFAAVPYTFELLERVRFTEMDLPSLRYLTQAGGRLDPATVRRYAELGQRRGWDLFVMYGQTEATARMAYLPPELAADSPKTIGIPVPGGAFRIDPVPGLEDGELVYTGPNVMLGYAESPNDLASGRIVEELRTGDLARKHPNGLYEVVGRRSRFVKILGLRIDLGQVDRLFSELGVLAASAGSDGKLVVAVEGDHDPGLLAKVAAQDLGLPRTALEVHQVEHLPRLATGKLDYPAILALSQPKKTTLAAEDFTAADSATMPPQHAPVCGPEEIRRIFAEELERSDVGEDSTFVALGGDSLSYVATSVRLEQALGHVPPDWHLTPVRDLVPRPRPGRIKRRFFAVLETSIVLRAVAIVFIVSTHADLFSWKGTAHVLIAVAGYNFARFQLAGERDERLRRQLRSLARIVVPSVVFIGLAYVLTDRYELANIVLLNTLVGPTSWTTQWDFWFIEVLVYLLVAMAALLAIPWADRAERRLPLAFPLALTAIGLLSRFDIVVPDILHTRPVLWLFALGWVIARVRTAPQRLGVSAVAALAVPGFFGDPGREATILVGILLLIWLPGISVPTGLRPLIVLLANASLYIYLTHWLVYPGLVAVHPTIAVSASLAAGVAYWMLVTRLPNLARRRGTRAARAPLVAGNSLVQPSTPKTPQ